MKGFSRTLIYVLFIVVIFYLFALKAQRSQTVELGRFPLHFLSGKNYEGTVIFKRRGDGSEFLVIKLNTQAPEEMIVLLTDQDGVTREIGRFQGATFIISLPQPLFFEKVKKIELQAAGGGQIWAETQIHKES